MADQYASGTPTGVWPDCWKTFLRSTGQPCRGNGFFHQLCGTCSA
ncbi:Uncharacterised protein [Vibrio cholerae]|nr:Uncharacterised protein [Vibrio cholerae]